MDSVLHDSSDTIIEPMASTSIMESNMLLGDGYDDDYLFLTGE